MPTDLDDFLERFAADGYRQQVADEENVPRSLPFFATALAVLVAIVGAVRSSIPPLSLSAYPIAIWVILICLSLELFLVLIFLREAVRKRAFKYVMSEQDLNTYVGNLRQYYQLDPNLTSEERETAILEDVRAELGNQYRDAASNNRSINFRRASARATALSSLVWALFFAFVMIALILTFERFAGDTSGRADTGQVEGKDRGSPPKGNPAGRQGPGASQTEPTSNANDQKGSVDVPGRGGAPVKTQPTERQEPMTQDAKPGANAPGAKPAAPPAPPRPKPAPPPMQTIKKNDPPGGLQK